MRADEREHDSAGEAAEEIGEEEFAGGHAGKPGYKVHHICGENRQDKSNGEEENAAFFGDVLPFID